MAASGSLALEHLRGLFAARLVARSDGDAPRLHGLGDLAHQCDGEQAVLELRAGHLDVVGEVEAALEGAGGDAAVEEARLVVFRLLLLAGDHQAVLLGGDVQRSEEHTSELQSLMRISYAVFCLNKKKK